MNFQAPKSIMLEKAYAACCEHVRTLDADRYLATLFAPAERQPHIFALYAFNAEIARVRGLVSDPLPGEMRFQWWRDLLHGEAQGDAARNPIAIALVATIQTCKLPVKPFTDLLEARTFDLYDDPMPTWLDCEGYCGETSSALIRLTSLALGGGADNDAAIAAGHAGVAFALTGLLRAFPWTCRRGQLFLPKEVFAAHGVDLADLPQGKDSSGLRAALGEVRERAMDHLRKTRELIGSVSPRIAPAFFPCCLVEPYLRQMEAKDYDPFRTRIDVSRLLKLFTLWRQSRRSRG
ncbi:MAG TPA: phytoene/squalene synthase family protein [Beijerinckiaceae bacterium]|nr:phytoene/squalene synthase family protein [Beijerinckiaceae bacterium]